MRSSYGQICSLFEKTCDKSLYICPLGKLETLQKLLIFQAGEYGHCKVVVKGIAINMGNCKDMHN